MSGDALIQRGEFAATTGGQGQEVKIREMRRAQQSLVFRPSGRNKINLISPEMMILRLAIFSQQIESRSGGTG
jgi:hypothetical protein